MGYCKNVQNFRSNLRPLNNGLEKNLWFQCRMISAIQNCSKFVNWTNFGKRFIVLGNPNHHESWCNNLLKASYPHLSKCLRSYDLFSVHFVYFCILGTTIWLLRLLFDLYKCYRKIQYTNISCLKMWFIQFKSTFFLLYFSPEN